MNNNKVDGLITVRYNISTLSHFGYLVLLQRTLLFQEVGHIDSSEPNKGMKISHPLPLRVLTSRKQHTLHHKSSSPGPMAIMTLTRISLLLLLQLPTTTHTPLKTFNMECTTRCTHLMTIHLTTGISYDARFYIASFRSSWIGGALLVALYSFLNQKTYASI